MRCIDIMQLSQPRFARRPGTGKPMIALKGSAPPRRRLRQILRAGCTSRRMHDPDCLSPRWQSHATGSQGRSTPRAAREVRFRGHEDIRGIKRPTAIVLSRLRSGQIRSKPQRSLSTIRHAYRNFPGDAKIHNHQFHTAKNQGLGSLFGCVIILFSFFPIPADARFIFHII